MVRLADYPHWVLPDDPNGVPMAQKTKVAGRREGGGLSFLGAATKVAAAVAPDAVADLAEAHVTRDHQRNNSGDINDMDDFERLEAEIARQAAGAKDKSPAAVEAVPMSPRSHATSERRLSDARERVLQQRQFLNNLKAKKAAEVIAVQVTTDTPPIVSPVSVNGVADAVLEQKRRSQSITSGGSGRTQGKPPAVDVSASISLDRPSSHGMRPTRPGSMGGSTRPGRVASLGAKSLQGLLDRNSPDYDADAAAEAEAERLEAEAEARQMQLEMSLNAESFDGYGPAYGSASSSTLGSTESFLTAQERLQEEETLTLLSENMDESDRLQAMAQHAANAQAALEEEQRLFSLERRLVDDARDLAEEQEREAERLAALERENELRGT